MNEWASVEDAKTKGCRKESDTGSDWYAQGCTRQRPESRMEQEQREGREVGRIDGRTGVLYH